MRNLANLAASAWQMIEIDQGGGKRRIFMLGRLIKWAVDRVPGEGDRREGGA